jgi:hypothetical protein
MLFLRLKGEILYKKIYLKTVLNRVVDLNLDLDPETGREPELEQKLFQGQSWNKNN